MNFKFVKYYWGCIQIYHPLYFLDVQKYLFHIVEPDLRILDEDGLGHQDEIFLAAGFPADGSGGGRAGHGGEEGGEGESEDEGWYSLSRTDVR